LTITDVPPRADDTPPLASVRRTFQWTVRRCQRASVLVGVVALAVACSSSPTTQDSTTTQDLVGAADARVVTAQANLTTASESLTTASEQFCGEASSYVAAIDRYGKLFTDSTATVGDVRAGGTDLAEPRESVTAAADAVATAQDELLAAQQELAAAQLALEEARATAASAPTSAITTVPATTTTLVPTATISRVKQAEEDLARVSEGITDATPLTEATAEYNSAALALEVAWLQVLSEAGCLTDEQQAEAVAWLTDYTVALQTQLQQAGYYTGPVDGVYGPQTVEAIEQLQSDSGLPVTGLVDMATARALEARLAELGQQASDAARTQTAAVQTALKLTGFWPGAIDGVWTDELTVALQNFQTALGVPPTGAVDAATLAAFQEALATIRDIVTSTTTTSTTTTTTTTLPPTSTTTDATTTTT
jgi:peptidoglycan hydrolase-like protein with peptidoglycan-binding domain